jgi:hypothetical protein
MVKSAYEIAMARLEKESGPARKLTDEQKVRIAAIDKRYEAKIAEQKLGAESNIGTAKTLEEVQQARANLANELRNLEEKRDREKEAVWNSD